MELRIFTEPQQGATYDTLLAVARTAEKCGFGAFFRSDHYLAMGGDGLPGPTDAWITLAGLARETSTIRLGTLMTAGTFRLPGPLAIEVAVVDQMSGGRVELGLGSGWFEQEHQAYGIPFPPVAERFDRYAEQLEIVTGLWETSVGQQYSFAGKHYQLIDSPALPKPAQSHIPMIIGGTGPKRTPALAARFADEFNVPFIGLDEAVAMRSRVEAACHEAGRSKLPVFSAALVTCAGASDAEVARRAGAIGREVDELTAHGLAGSPAQIVDRLGEWSAAGITRIYLQILDLTDLDHLELIASEIMPQL